MLLLKSEYQATLIFGFLITTQSNPTTSHKPLSYQRRGLGMIVCIRLDRIPISTTGLELRSEEREQSVDSMCSPEVSKWDTCHKEAD